MSTVSSADAFGAAVAAAAQRVAAYADKQHIAITPGQYEELAEILVNFVEGFVVGARYAAASQAEPGE